MTNRSYYQQRSEARGLGYLIGFIIIMTLLFFQTITHTTMVMLGKWQDVVVYVCNDTNHLIDNWEDVEVWLDTAHIETDPQRQGECFWVRSTFETKNLTDCSGQVHIRWDVKLVSSRRPYRGTKAVPTTYFNGDRSVQWNLFKIPNWTGLPRGDKQIGDSFSIEGPVTDICGH